jgi:hypothetical protein
MLGMNPPPPPVLTFAQENAASIMGTAARSGSTKLDLILLSRVIGLGGINVP